MFSKSKHDDADTGLSYIAERMRDTLRRSRETGSYERNFRTLYVHRTEPDEMFRRENAQYVPLFFAAPISGENPAAFELQIPPPSSLTQPAGNRL